MHSDLVGKIEKARLYAQEPERIAIDELRVRFNGGNNDHIIALANGHWSCDCNFFHRWQTCAHIMALQKILGVMLSAGARKALAPASIDQEQATVNSTVV